MSHTLAHIRADIIDIATSGSNPIDFRIPDSQVDQWIHQTRAMLISQAIDKRQDISDVWLQPITCLNLIEVDKSECCEIITNCKLLRTELQLPVTVETKKDNLILRVLKPNGQVIDKLSNPESRYIHYSKYGVNNCKYYVKNQYIYIINDDMLETIGSVYGIWDNPTDLSTYTSCNNSTCYTASTPYPCSLKMAKDIVSIVLKERVFPYLQLPQDNSNDSNNSIDQPISNKLK